MPGTAAGSPVCAVCGTDTETGRSFMRLHLAAGRLEFCTPHCVAVYHVQEERRAVADPALQDGRRAWLIRWGP